MGRAQIEVRCVLFWPNVVFHVLLNAHFLRFAFQQSFCERKVCIYGYNYVFFQEEKEVQKCSIDLYSDFHLKCSYNYPIIVFLHLIYYVFLQRQGPDERSARDKYLVERLKLV
jgi:hypothetical protein